MSETRVTAGVRKESDASDSSSATRPILDVESDAFSRRLKDVIGDKKVVRFASECRLPESNIRSYLNGKFPSIDKAASIAEAGGVTLDWLATGRLPKVRERHPAAPSQAQSQNGEPPPFDGRRDMLEAVLRVMEHRITNNQVDQTVIDAGLKGAPAWLEAARDYPDLQVRLRSAIATLEFMSAAGLG